MAQAAPPGISPLYDPRWRSIAFQLLLCAVIVWLAYSAVTNAAESLARARIASGFDFWHSTAGFDISQHLIPYTPRSTYGRAFWVGLLNTLLVSFLGIIFATVIGFLIGILQLSKNMLVAKLARGYVPVTTWSAHYLPDPNFRRAVADYLERERAAVAHEQEFLGELTPFRQGG